jgi:hypothetical protein
MTERGDRRVGGRRTWSFAGALVACLTIVVCAVAAAGFGVHLARAADHIHQCNDFDIEPCEAGWTFPFTFMEGIGTAAGLVLVVSAAWLAALRVRHAGFSRVGGAFFVALAFVGVASAALIVHTAARGRAIYPYGDPSQWMNVGVVLLAVQAVILLVLGAFVIRGSLAFATRRLSSAEGQD